MLFGLESYTPDATSEALVTRVQTAMIQDCLLADRSVVVDDMNLRSRYVRRLLDMAVTLDKPYQVIDLTHVPVDLCVERDAQRLGGVGQKVIEGLHTRFLRGRPSPLPVPEPKATATLRPYEPDPWNPQALVVDIDGTVAEMVERGPFEYDKVLTDRPKPSIVALVQAAQRSGHQIVFVSGRKDTCEEDTRTWLDQYVTTEYELHMRGADDNRDDAIVKATIFGQVIRDRWNVTAVLDDRDRVVGMWRAIGLTCLQVAPGDF